MAKWGEGDPRWIVEERPDATNVNNWHWTEKNASTWSKDRLRELLIDLKLDNTEGTCKITELDRCEGEASANNRKAKIIVFFEWDLKMKWKGKLKDGETASGTVEIPNLSDENSVDDLDIQFLCDTTKDAALKMKSALRKECSSVVKTQLQKYIDSLKKEYTQGMILPKKDQVSMNSKFGGLSLDSSRASTVNNSSTSTSASSSSGAGVKLQLCDIESKTTMKCTATDVFHALMKPEMFVAFTNGSGRIDPKVGGTFDMFGGNVHGKILEIEAPTKIVQLWRFKYWPDGHYSIVTFSIREKEDSTHILVKQTGVPTSDVEKTKEGWNEYYWDAMKRTFGFGSFIL